MSKLVVDSFNYCIWQLSLSGKVLMMMYSSRDLLQRSAQISKVDFSGNCNQINCNQICRSRKQFQSQQRTQKLKIVQTSYHDGFWFLLLLFYLAFCRLIFNLSEDRCPYTTLGMIKDKNCVWTINAQQVDLLKTYLGSSSWSSQTNNFGKLFQK